MTNLQVMDKQNQNNPDILLYTSQVRFVSKDHTYWLDEKQLHGITSTLIRSAFPDTYSDVPRHILDKAAANGTVMHQTIEIYDELGVTSDMPELQSYIDILKEHQLKVLATEYVVSDNTYFATCIDKVFLCPDGSIMLADLKRTAEIHFREVRLQLSLCRLFFSMLNPHLPEPMIAVMRLREQKRDFIPLNPLPDSYLYALIDSYISGSTAPDFPEDSSDTSSPAPVTCTDGPRVPSSIADTEREVYELERKLADMKQKKEKLAKGLLQLMQEHNIKQWKGSLVSLTRTLPSSRKSFDSAAFKADHPDLYNEYLREKEVAPSLRISITRSE